MGGTLRRCFGCRQDREAETFLAGLCGDCFAAGRPSPPGPSASLESILRSRRVRVERRETPRNVVKQEEEPIPDEAPDQPPKLRCRYCGKMLSKGGIWTHEHKACPKRPGAGEATDATIPRARKVTAARTAKRPSPPVPDEASRGPATGHANGCFCHGLDSALAKELVTDAIRGGMNLEGATAFVRRAMNAGGAR